MSSVFADASSIDSYNKSLSLTLSGSSRAQDATSTCVRITPWLHEVGYLKQCLKQCSATNPPCITAEGVEWSPPETTSAAEDCGASVDEWIGKVVAVKAGEGSDDQEVAAAHRVDLPHNRACPFVQWGHAGAR